MTKPITPVPEQAIQPKGAPNAGQQQAISAPGNWGIRVIAGAGTGKTFLMSRRFLELMARLMEQGVAHPEEHLLAVTFTVKAARQMREKIQKLVRETGHNRELSPYAHISNFHGFCNRILRQHALDLDLTPDFGVLAALEQNLLMERMFSGIRHGDYPDISRALRRAGLEGQIRPDILSLEYLTGLRNAVSDPLADLVTDLPRMLEKIKSAGLSPAQFFEVARKQTQNLTQALQALPIRSRLDGDYFPTNQAYCEAWETHLKDWADDHWSLCGTEDERVAWNEANRPDDSHFEWYYRNRLSVFTDLKHAGEYVFPRGQFPRGKPPFFKPGTEDLGFLSVIEAEELRYVELVAGTYALYQQILQEKNYCDFDDLINRTLELFEKRPELLAQYQQHFETLIVDEFQDSNGSQLRLMQALMKPGRENLTVVGDLKQSIYGFRHAQPENMALIFSPEGRDAQKDIPLTINYRSRAPILRVANHMADLITDGDPDQQLSVCDKYAPSPDDPKVGWVELGVPQISLNSKGEEVSKDEPVGELRSREARFIAVEAARLIASGRAPREIAVLVKSHRKAQSIEKALRELGVPAIKQKNRGFFSEPVILDALALLRLLQNPHEEMPLVRLLQKKLNARQLRVLADYRDSVKIPLFEAIGQLQDTGICPEIPLDVRQALLHLHELVRRRKSQLGQANLVSVFLELADDIGLVEPDTPQDAQIEARMHINILKRLLYQLIRKGSLHPSLSEILATLERYRNDPDLELPVSEENLKENAVQIMTIHSAKGLEFPVVFAACVEDSKVTATSDLLYFEPQYPPKPGFGLFLGKCQGERQTLKKLIYNEAWYKPRQEAEQKRLFYVAVTRAMEKLYVIRGPQTFEWTAATHFPPEALEIMRETDDPASFEARYLGADTQALREQVRRALPRKEDVPALAKTHPLRSAEEEPAPEPLILSFSALNSHRQCPVQYMLKYAWGLPEPPAKDSGSGASSLALARGSCLHALIEKHYRLKGDVPDMLVASLMDACLPEAGNSDTLEKQRQTVRDTYHAFLASEYSYTALTHAGYRIETERPLRFPLGGTSASVMIRGSLDLLLHHPDTDTHTLIDFKTNRELKPKHLETYFEQLLLYREGLLAVMPDCTLPDDHLKLVHLTPQGLFTHACEKAAASSHRMDTVLRRVEAIDALHRAGGLPDRPAETDCAGLRCPYLGICPKARNS